MRTKKKRKKDDAVILNSKLHAIKYNHLGKGNKEGEKQRWKKFTKKIIKSFLKNSKPNYLFLQVDNLYLKA